MRSIGVVTIAAIIAATATRAHAQDQDHFGAAVAIAGSDVFVVKPAAARGPAAVYVMRRDAEGWTVAEHLTTRGAANGVLLGAAIAVTASGVIAGGADPDGRFGAHSWARGGNGGWGGCGGPTEQRPRCRWIWEPER